MKTYGTLERRVAKALDAFPQLRSMLKKTYQKLQYARYRQRGFQCALHDDVSIRTAYDWGGMNPPLQDAYFFGYYDKPPWNAKQNRLLLHRISGAERKVTAYTGTDHGANIVVLDRTQARAIDVARTSVWNAQQGAMAQWLPKQEGHIVYNDIRENSLVGIRLDVETGDSSVMPYPVQAVHPNGKCYLSLNYRRLDRLRPDYGYGKQVGNFQADADPARDGIWQTDFDTGQTRLWVSLADLMELNHRSEMDGAHHKVNHIMYAPNGQNVVFMHRWIGDQGKFSRLYVADQDGERLRIVLDERMVSHYSFKDDRHLLVWGRTEEREDQYYLINLETLDKETIGNGVLNTFGDGHPSYAPGGRWIVTDTYPDKARQRHLLLYDTERQQLFTVGRFFAPWKFDGTVRCDLHPRWSPDGRALSIDSAHEGVRRSYVLDLEQFLQQNE